MMRTQTAVTFTQSFPMNTATNCRLDLPTCYKGLDILDGDDARVRRHNASFRAFVAPYRELLLDFHDSTTSSVTEETTSPTPYVFIKACALVSNTIYDTILQSGADFLDLDGEPKSRNDAIQKIVEALQDEEQQEQGPCHRRRSLDFTQTSNRCIVNHGLNHQDESPLTPLMPPSFFSSLSSLTMMTSIEDFDSLFDKSSDDVGDMEWVA